MTVEDFRKIFEQEISSAVARIDRRYSVTDDEMFAALYHSAKKCLSGARVGESGNGGLNPDARKETVDLLAAINCEDLCLAVACAKGDEAAWEDFFREYRSYMVSMARGMTQDAGAAEQLADSTFAELYGLRESSGARVSKFSFYSGRGSLRGWLRAVVYQLSADSHRQTSRFVQTEEPEDMDRLVRADVPARASSGELGFIRERYRAAVSDALRAALKDLEPRERLLLAYYYYDELTLREIGRMFKVHEATISRWLTKVQKRIRKLVEKNLSRDHHFNRREVTEAIELAAEQMDINVRQYLFESAPSDRERERTTESAGEAVAPR
ncbi:MAG TPA: sigma-70 family RNA polymerase sigma factor [Blastocatellia bacterium]|nr:sigma-70 family RNA polymerase sigma factor [Blastocatellia bacterium]